MMIDISEEDLEFIKHLAHEMRTQDNVATANPRYIVVMGKREFIAPSGYGDKVVLLDLDADERGPAYDSKEDMMAALKSEKLSDEEIANRIDNAEECGMHVVDFPSNFFLTRKGYDEHMRLNSHNYSSYEHPYMEHAFRNPELDTLIKVIDRIGLAVEKRDAVSQSGAPRTV